MEEVSSKTQMAKIRNFERGFMATHLINIGNKIGVFEKLNEKKEEGFTVADLASELGVHEPYLKFWCQTAYHFELLDCDNQGKFKLQPFLDEILGDKGHFRNYLANITMDVDLFGTVLAEAHEHFKTGKTLNLEAVIDEEVVRKAYGATKNIYLVFLFMIFPKNEHLKEQLDKGIKFLDIGCGNGSLITQFANAFPNSKFVGISPEAYGLKFAKTTISQMGLEDRVAVENIGGEKLSYKDEFDMASMVVTLHEISPDVRESVVERAYQALKSGGYIMILDFPYPSDFEDFRNPKYEYGILDQFYETTMGTVHLNNNEQNELLTKTGFKDIQRMPIGKGMFDFITAVK
jgi:ubiquinone/menaquinone biosynthesis C-methylase UbiE